MTRIILKNKPLVEAIFELRWALQEKSEGIAVDPQYSVLVGRLYDRVKDEYVYHEQLATASMPAELVPYMAQHRFRVGKDSWPLIQLGPGVVTVNDTRGYVWEDFERRILRTVATLIEAYPEPDSLRPNLLQLRYIDAVEFDFQKANVLAFLSDQMGTSISLPKGLFDDTGVAAAPSEVDLRFVFPSTHPKGQMYLRLVRGQKRTGESTLVWESIVQSFGDDAANAKADIGKWAAEAHDLTDDWFFKILGPDLLRRFE